MHRPVPKAETTPETCLGGGDYTESHNVILFMNRLAKSGRTCAAVTYRICTYASGPRVRWCGYRWPDIRLHERVYRSQRGDSPFVYRDDKGWPASLPYIRVSVAIGTQSRIRLHETVYTIGLWSKCGGAQK